MLKSLNFIKTTLLGGIIFLLPFVVLVVIVQKAVEIMRGIAKPLKTLVPVDTIAGISVLTIIALVSVILLSFIAGLIAKSSAGKRSFLWVDSKLITLIPGYSLIKGFTSQLQKEHDENKLKPVLVRFDDVSQVGFEVERLSDGSVTVFLPDSPDMHTGTVVYMEDKRVEILDTDFSTAFRILRVLGRGSKNIIKSVK